MDSIVTNSMIDTGLTFDNSYAEQLEGFYTLISGAKAPKPELIKFNYPLMEELGIKFNNLQTEDIAIIFSGSISPIGAAPLAQVYAGHQFGGFSPHISMCSPRPVAPNS